MPRTYRRKSRRKSRRNRRGGNYYPYNKTPMLFTEPSNQIGGWAGDPRTNLFPDLITNMVSGIQYNSQSSVNSFFGSSPPVNPSAISQPIGK